MFKPLSFAILTLIISNAAFAEGSLTGAGSTFVYPALSKWADAYNKETGTTVNYQSIGSGGGIKQIEAGTVDFGATDMPMKPEELTANGLVQFPLVNGATVPVVHLGLVKAGQLKLSGDVLAKIYLGEIKKWNDPKIKALNTALSLPDKDITVVHRSDGSGTSFIWTNYLSKVSADWKSKIGEGTAVQWPAGVGAKGNEGVALQVQQIDGSIGYVEFAYASQNKMAWAKLKNAAGEFVEPSAGAFKAAAAGADWAHAKNFYLILTNANGKASWPVAGSTFVLMHAKQTDAAKAAETLKFFNWAYTKGVAMAEELNYVAIPTATVKQIEASWKTDIKTDKGAPIATGL